MPTLLSPEEFYASLHPKADSIPSSVPDFGGQQSLLSPEEFYAKLHPETIKPPPPPESHYFRDTGEAGLKETSIGIGLQALGVVGPPPENLDLLQRTAATGIGFIADPVSWVGNIFGAAAKEAIIKTVGKEGVKKIAESFAKRAALEAVQPAVQMATLETGRELAGGNVPDPLKVAESTVAGALLGPAGQVPTKVGKLAAETAALAAPGIVAGQPVGESLAAAVGTVGGMKVVGKALDAIRSKKPAENAPPAIQKPAENAPPGPPPLKPGESSIPDKPNIVIVPPDRALAEKALHPLKEGEAVTPEWAAAYAVLNPEQSAKIIAKEGDITRNDVMATRTPGALRDAERSVQKDQRNQLRDLLKGQTNEVSPNEVRANDAQVRQGQTLGQEVPAKAEEAQVPPVLTGEGPSPLPGMAAATPSDLFADRESRIAPPERIKETHAETAKVVDEVNRASGDTGLKAGVISRWIREKMGRVWDALNPAYEGSELAQFEYLGTKSRDTMVAQEALGKFEAQIDKYPDEPLRQWHADYETGKHENIPAPILEAQNAVTRVLKGMYQRVQALKGRPVSDADVIDNFLARIYDKRPDELKAAREYLLTDARSPMRGSNQHTKPRFFEDVIQALDKGGFALADQNYVRLALAKADSLSKAYASEALRKAQGRFVAEGARDPEGYRQTKGTKDNSDPSFAVWHPGNLTFKESFDQKMMAAAVGFAHNLGVDVRRTMSIRNGRGIEPWGRYDAKTDSIDTKFAGGVQPLLHEIGHAIDERYDLFKRLGGDPVIDKEWSDLARERLGKDPTTGQKKYAFNPKEKAAALVEAYTHAPELLAVKAPKLKTAFEKFIAEHPELSALNDIKPGLELGEAGKQINPFGPVKIGHWAFPERLAQAIDNHQGRSIAGSPLLAAARFFNNVMTSVNLIGYAHMAGNMMREIGNELASGIADLSSGKFASGLKHILKSPFTPITTPLKGKALTAEYAKEYGAGPHTLVTRGMILANARPTTDKWWRLSGWDEVQKNLRKARFAGTSKEKLAAQIKVGWYTPQAVIDTVLSPMRKYTELLKVGRFGEILQNEIGRLGRPPTEAEFASMSTRAWGSVEDRMGLMTHENVNMPRAWNDILGATIRSRGWTGGTIRWMIGSADDALNIAARAKEGKPWMTERMAYVVGSLAATSAAGAIRHFVGTGQAPQTITDLLYPKTGFKNPDGTDAREKFLTDWPDIISYYHHPLETISHKLAPAISAVYEVAMTNRNYFGNMIRNPEDSAYQQVQQVLADQWQRLLPFGVTSGQRNIQQGQGAVESYVKPALALIPAPTSETKSPAVQYLHEHGHQEELTPEEAAKKTQRFDLRSKARQEFNATGKTTKAAADMRKAGELSAQSQRLLLQSAKSPPIVNAMKYATAEVAMEAYAVATPEERKLVEQLIRLKINNALENRPKNERDVIRNRAIDLGLKKGTKRAA